ncbi:MAG: glycosyltransferase [Candidatus Micrarchaeota archaeon]|nr:glycosyltransferase [Candidatus Micrarchaeota archaeon]
MSHNINMLFETISVGGIETGIANLTKYLDRLKIYSIYDINLQPQNIKNISLTKAKHISKAELYLFLLKSPVIAKRMANYLSDGEVLITHTNRAHLIGHLSQYFRRIEWIPVMHMTDLLYSKFRQEMTRRLVGRANRIVFVSHHMKHAYRPIFPNKELHTIYNSLDVDRIRQRASEYKFSLDNYILNIGRFHPIKNQKFLIDLYSRIKDVIGKRLVILGFGESKDDLKRFAESKHLRVSEDPNAEADVYIFRSENPYPIIANASAYIHTSVGEGFSVSLIEALSLNVPIFTSDHRFSAREALGIYDFDTSLEYPYRTDLGVLFPVATSVESKEGKIWMENLPKLLDEYSRVPGERFVTERFHPRVIAERWKDLVFGERG